MVSWNVLIDDFNASRIEIYNVFDHGGVVEELKTAIKKISDKQAFSVELRHIMMYYFWAKCEWEVVVTSWPGGRGERKIDVFYQLNLNWDAFVNYVWDHRDEICKLGN